MKPYISQLYGSTAPKYTIGISGKSDYVDQKRNAILIRPGQQTMIKVFPRLVETTKDFDHLENKERNCWFVLHQKTIANILAHNFM